MNLEELSDDAFWEVMKEAHALTPETYRDELDFWYSKTIHWQDLPSAPQRGTEFGIVPFGPYPRTAFEYQVRAEWYIEKHEDNWGIAHLLNYGERLKKCKTITDIDDIIAEEFSTIKSRVDFDEDRGGFVFQGYRYHRSKSDLSNIDFSTATMEDVRHFLLGTALSYTEKFLKEQQKKGATAVADTGLAVTPRGDLITIQTQIEQAGKPSQIDFDQSIGYLNHDVMERFTEIEKLACIEHELRFTSAVRCAAFCELAYMGNYIKSSPDNPQQYITEFARLRYSTNIEHVLKGGKTSDRREHQSKPKQKQPKLLSLFTSELVHKRFSLIGDRTLNKFKNM